MAFSSIKNPMELKEMDIVLFRDGRLGIVLYNDVEKCHSVFDYESLWCISLLCDYHDDFSYGRRTEHYNKDIDSKKDIIAISRQRTYWYALNRIKEYKAAIRFKDLDRLKESFNKFDWQHTQCFEKMLELTVDDLIIDIHYFDEGVPKFIGYIKSNKFDPDECFNLCNWTNWTDKKPENLYADIQSVGKGICFTNPITHEKHLALSAGWYIGDSADITEYVRINKDSLFWK